MIQEDYCTFEQAKLLKEKGFHELCHYETHAYYLDRNLGYHRNARDFNGDEYSGLTTQWYSRPTLSLVDKWLRKEKDIDMDISCNKGVTYKYYDCYIHEISDFICDKEDNPIHFNTYEEALSEGINKALELI